MRGALLSVEQSRDEYTGSVFGAAALAYITIIHATDAIDMMQKRLPDLYKERTIKKFVNIMLGTKASMGEIRRLTLSIGDLLAHDCDRAWVMDFGNAAYEKVQYREAACSFSKCAWQVQRAGHQRLCCHSCRAVACE